MPCALQKNRHFSGYIKTLKAVCGPELCEVSQGKVHESVSKGMQPSNVLEMKLT